jgi:hypothetical protein
MPSNSETILTSNTHTGDSVIQTVTGVAYKGDGYYGRSDGFHTVQYDVANFLGTIIVQGTLATTPTDDDWFTITSSEHTSVANDSSSLTSDGGFIYNFTGNYVWVRAYISNWTDGTINSIKLNH